MIEVPDSPKELGFQYKDWRKFQRDAVNKIVNSEKRFFVLDAPTGSGKSLIAMSVAKLLGNKSYYLVSTKQLQEQVLVDFPEVKKVVGRNNFLCQHGLGKLSCEDGLYCSAGLACPERATCPYFKQRQEAMESQIVTMNYSYALSSWTYTNDWEVGDLLILDEAHLVESELFKFVGLELSTKNFHDYNFTFPGSEDKVLERVEDLYSYLKEEISEIKGRYQMTLLMQLSEELDTKDIVELRKMEKLYNKISFILKQYNDNDWVIDYKRLREFKKSKVIFKPIFVSGYANLLFDNGVKVIMQSATMPNLDILCRGLSISKEDVECLSIPSTFPVERTPIIYRPVGKLSYAHIDENLPKAIDEIYKITEQNLDKKILIHTSNYRISREIGDTIVILDEKENKVINIRVFGHDNAEERLSALEDFKSAEAPAILVSPSFETGVDLPFDQCRVQIIVKIPFLSLGDKQTKKRMEIDREWYISATINRLVQASGRAMRAEDDSCKTYVLDECFKGLVGQYSNMFPSWFLSRIAVEE